jgi:transposase-like protein
MSGMICKRCSAADYVKNGKVRALQRYRCKACGCNFTATKPRGKPAAMKTLALLLYGMGNAGYRMIARLLGLSHVSVYSWIRTEAARLPEPEITGETVILTLDEMWHFLKKPQLRIRLEALACERDGRLARPESVGDEAGQDMDHGVDHRPVA